jgi:hypothetical protein
MVIKTSADQTVLHKEIRGVHAVLVMGGPTMAIKPPPTRLCFTRKLTTTPRLVTGPI